MLVAVENEEIVERQGDRWEYVRDTQTGWRGYLHMNCDVLVNEHGYCMMCGSPCPTLWPEVARDREEQRLFEEEKAAMIKADSYDPQ